MFDGKVYCRKCGKPKSEDDLLNDDIYLPCFRCRAKKNNHKRRKIKDDNLSDFEFKFYKEGDFFKK